MDGFTNFLLASITILIGVIGYLLKKTFDKIEEVAKDVSDIKPKVDIIWRDMLPKLDILWRDRAVPANSPRQLNERGQKILNESGIGEIVDELENKLLDEVGKHNAANPYDAERFVERVMADLPNNHPELIDKLKLGAYNAGENMETVLYIGAIYLRNRIFPKLGFSVESSVEDTELEPETPS
ncbi:MAG TPA: hypothetical protein VJI73_00350 [Candidatus Paceibacterota bacterium]